MKYQVKSSKLQDVQTNTVRFTAPAHDLGSVASNALKIPLDEIMEFSDQEEFRTQLSSRILIAKNLSEDTVLVASIPEFPADSDLYPDLVLQDVAMAKTDIIEIVIKLK
jgi:response regulator RpfG family c-di-GMP phosphodiesterase